MPIPPNNSPDPALDGPIGRDVIAEAASLLPQMQFGDDAGACAQGEHLMIYISAERSRPEQTMSALVTCHAFRRRTVDWEGLPVVLLRDDSGEHAAVQFFNSRGHAFVAGINPGIYGLESPKTHGRSRKPVALPSPHAPNRLYAHGRVAVSSNMFSMFLDSMVVDSNDGRVSATVRRKEAETIVAFETRDPMLAGALVRFAFIPKSGRVKYCGSVQLRADAAVGGLWNGWWSQTLVVEEPCELMFAVSEARPSAAEGSSISEFGRKEALDELRAPGTNLEQRADARTEETVVGIRR